MGCGRVGSSVAHTLEDRGHSVAVIDQEPEAFRKLRSGFKGIKVTGVGFDRDVLTEAGIERAGAFAAVSSGDNSNVIAARWPGSRSACSGWWPGSTTPGVP